MKTEIAAMQELCHQHICKLYQVIETVDRFYMVLEVSLASLPLPGMMRRRERESPGNGRDGGGGGGGGVYMCACESKRGA